LFGKYTGNTNDPPALLEKSMGKWLSRNSRPMSFKWLMVADVLSN